MELNPAGGTGGAGNDPALSWSAGRAGSSDTRRPLTAEPGGLFTGSKTPK